MLGRFDIPSVDHLREGVDYQIIDWDFAASAPIPHTPGESCPPGTKMVFGMCRRVKEGTQDWNTDEDSDSERAGKIKAKEVGSSFQNNKPVEVGGKKYGWAKKGGKDVLVAWGSVCAKKDKDGNCISSTGQVTPKQPTPATPAPAPAPAPPAPAPAPAPAPISA